MKKLTFLISAVAWLMAMPVMAEVGDEFTSGNLKFKVITAGQTLNNINMFF